MNQGAEVATGKILCFLHADTSVPDDLLAVIEQTLADQTVAAGGFISLMVAPRPRWSVATQLPQNLLRSLNFSTLPVFQGLRLLFGDQVMFCRRNDFGTMGF
jgi:hypothetical protein